MIELSFLWVFILFYFILAMPLGLWDLSSPNSDGSPAHCSRIVESSPPDLQGRLPHILTFHFAEETDSQRLSKSSPGSHS